LHWKPTATLEQGLERTIDWFRNNVSKYRSDAYVL
jgi:dTDP-D-glucose 4,6-dehydratase